MKKCVLVTGVSKGLGLEVTKLALKDGYAVFGLSRTMTEDLQSIKSDYKEDFQWMSLDLMDKSINIRESVFKNFLSNKIPLAGFVNNAAVAYDDIVTNLNVQRLEEMFKANVFAPFEMTKYAIRNMIFNKISGSIIHVSSISVHTGYKGLAMYAASKGALEAFSKNTAREWGELGIRSNALVAGFMETAMSSKLSADQKNRIYNRTSLKKPTTTKSVAETILYLLSDASSSITGQNIFVDSGTI